LHQDVRELRDFYYRTRLGRMAQRALRAQVAEFWGDTKGQTIAGFGFSVPLMRPLLKGARRGIALMPGQQGVMAWPSEGANISLLCEESDWPLPTGIVDKLIILHGLETCETPDDLLIEAYRVLGPGGRALIVVPNRSGLWARRDVTPFARGRPYSLGQLERQLAGFGLEVRRHRAALFFPPSEKPFWRRMTQTWEKVGNRLSRQIAGGVLMVEVSKQIPAPTRPGLGAMVRRPLVVLEGLTAPASEPASGRVSDRKRPVLRLKFPKTP
jgi:SAM-dependent methyltransferase